MSPVSDHSPATDGEDQASLIAATKLSALHLTAPHPARSLLLSVSAPMTEAVPPHFSSSSSSSSSSFRRSASVELPPPSPRGPSSPVPTAALRRCATSQRMEENKKESRRRRQGSFSRTVRSLKADIDKLASQHEEMLQMTNLLCEELADITAKSKWAIVARMIRANEEEGVET